MGAWKHLAATAAVCLMSESVWAAPDVSLVDEDPKFSHWSAELLSNETGVPLSDASLGDAAAGGVAGGPHLRGRFPVAARQCAAGEPPAGPDGLCFGRALHTLFFTQGSYVPARDGAVSAVDVSVQLNASAPVTPPPATVLHAHPSTVNVYLAFRQDGVTYWRLPLLLADTWTPPEDPEGDWNAGGAEIGPDDDFVHFDDESGAIVGGGPNLVDGGPVEVGLLFSTSSRYAAHPNSNYTDNHGVVIDRVFAIDDFEVVLHRADVDADGVDDEQDNCTWVANGSETGVQCDTDRDGYGNACDGDFDQNHLITAGDLILLMHDSEPPGLDSGVGTDMDCDGSVNAIDFLTYFMPSFDLGKPSPSGLPCAGEPDCDL
jgi:hypothetical protein